MKNASYLVGLSFVLVIALGTSSAGRADRSLIVPLQVENGSPVARQAAPVSFGVPLPKDRGIHSVGELGVNDPSGQPVPAQGTVLSRWNGTPDDATKPIKWILLDFQAGIPAHGVRTFALVRRGLSPAPAEAIRVNEEQGVIEVSTGAATFRISRQRFSVFEEIRLPAHGGADVSIARASKTDGLEYRTPESRHIKAGPPDSARVELIGPLHAVINVRGRFVDDIGRPTFLYYVARYHFYAGHRDARLLLTVTDRHDRPMAEGQWDKRWDAQQVLDLRLVLTLVEPSRIVLLPTTERGSTIERLALPNESSHLRLTQLSPHSDRIAIVGQDRVADHKGYMEVSGSTWLPRTDWRSFQGNDFLAHEADGGRSHLRWVATTRVLDQRTSGWMSLGTFDFLDRAEVTVHTTGTGRIVADALRIQSATAGRSRHPVTVDRDRSLGWIYALGRHVGMGVGLPEFWQNAPKDLLVTGEGRIEVGLLPEGPHHFMGGLGKTHELVFSPRLAAPGGAPDHADGAFLDPPLHALAPPDWYSKTGALAHLRFRGHRGATVEERQYEALIEKAVDPERASLRTEIERRQWYGWRNYGDFEVGNPYWTAAGPVEDWANGMMDYATGLLTQYLRTGRQPYWVLGRAAAWHLADIGLVKFHPFDAKSNGTVHRKGECLRPHSHVCQDPIAGQAFAHRSLVLLYHLTGDSWFLETARMNFEYAVNLSAPRLTRPYFLADGGRDTAWILEALLSGYEQSSERRYLDLAIQLFERKVVAQHDVTGGIVNPAVDNDYSPARAPMIQPWMVGYLGNALIHYHSATADPRAAQMVVGLARFLRDFGTRRARIPAKGEPDYTGLIPDQLAGKSPRYVLYTWTYEQQRTAARVKVRSVDGSRLRVAYEEAGPPARVSDLRGKLLFLTSGRAASRRFLISSTTNDMLSLACVRGTEGRCSNDLARDGLQPGDTGVITQPDEYLAESVTYNFVPLDTLAFATRQTGDPSYLQLARELFAYAIGVLGDQGYIGPREASDYLTPPHLFLEMVSTTPR